MSSFWVVVMSIHLLAAMAWLGGMIFISFVLAPLIRGGHVTTEQVALFRSAARRFRILVWISILSLVITGPFLLRARDFSLYNPTDWPVVLRIKIALVGLFLLLTIAHDLYLGPRATQFNSIPAGVRTPLERRLRVASRWLPRLSLLIGVAVLVVAVILANS